VSASVPGELISSLSGALFPSFSAKAENPELQAVKKRQKKKGILATELHGKKDDTGP
jgi:hypothetical protein